MHQRESTAAILWVNCGIRAMESGQKHPEVQAASSSPDEVENRMAWADCRPTDEVSWVNPIRNGRESTQMGL
jgi:hypothetical protein